MLRSAVGAVVRSEAGIARALRNGVRGRAPASGGAVALPYAGRFGVVVGGMVAIGAVELGVVHLLLPWPAVRWALFVLGVYALVWAVGFGLTLRQHPHLLRGADLVLRFGHFRSTVVPLQGLVGARRAVDAQHRRNVVLEGDRLALSVLGETNVELRFDPPVQVPGQPRPVARVAFFADDPAAAVRELRALSG
ncbi:hypothetical protein [Geodermatophilus sp. CPCC 206100]|uniref:hypothetical protein n=1 Tax=Geodermatophilus sp. CPCC 206100 TaxID=3020054 RepID=UPI003B008D70